MPPENLMPFEGNIILVKDEGELRFVGDLLKVNKVWSDLLSIKLIELVETLARSGSIKIPRSLTPVVVIFDGIY